MKKRSPRLTDDEMVQIALARFEAYRTRGRAASFEELSEAFDKRDPSVLVRAITRAFRKGLVSVTPVRSPQPTEDADLSVQLRRHFPIDTAIVVRADASGADDLPRLLGVALARHLGNSSAFRHGEAIAMSPGRSCFWVCKAMAEQPPLTARDISIYSLSGSWGARRAPYVNQIMDADSNALTLAQAFSERVRLVQMLSAMITSEPLSRSLSKTWMARGDVRVDHIVVGAGVVMKYKQWIFDDPDISAMDRELTVPIRQAFDKLVALCERFAIVKDGRLIHCHVGDLGNHLIFVPWPLQDPITPDAERQMRALIDEINEKMLTPRKRFWFTGRTDDFSKEQINETVVREARRNGPRIMLIAGGREKGSVVHALLHQGYPISVLCTTTDVAEFLLLNRKAGAQAPAPPPAPRTRKRARG